MINTIVIKIASRCNLNCSYCYVYNQGDNTYLKQPKLMSYNTVDMIINRFLGHCISNNVKAFTFVFHGGEPLLQKKEFFKYFIESSDRILVQENEIRCLYTTQTNGVLISKEWCELFNSLNIHMGVSLDGDKETNDKYRVDHQGKGAYNSVIKGLEISQKYSISSPGILSVIDIESDPVKFFNHLISLNVKSVDLLWPHATHDIPPINVVRSDKSESLTPYADWLIIIFDLWFTDEVNSKIEISIFETFIKLILGNEMHWNEDFGSEDNGILVVETNGDIQAVGALKICGDGFTISGANIETHSLSQSLETKLAKVYHKSHKMLNSKCLNCPIVEICGGGHIHTRFSKENGFDNASVYCKDFIKLIAHIQNSIFDSLPKKYQEQLNRISSKEIMEYMENLNFEDLENSKYSKELSSF